MTPLLISIRYLLLFIVLIQSASLYKIYALDDNPSNFLSNSLSSSSDEQINQGLPIKNLGYNDEDIVYDENNDNLASWLSLVPEMREQQRKRAAFPFKLRSSQSLPQRRNNRPHWNPLVAAYKRCGELSRPEERESCFKDAIQMLFVHKLRK